MLGTHSPSVLDLQTNVWELVLDEAPAASRPTIISVSIVAAVPARATLEDVRGHALLGDDPRAVIGPDTPAAGVELVAAAVALAAVVGALALLQHVGDRVLRHGLGRPGLDGGVAGFRGELKLS